MSQAIYQIIVFEDLSICSGETDKLVVCCGFEGGVGLEGECTVI